MSTTGYRSASPYSGCDDSPGSCGEFESQFGHYTGGRVPESEALSVDPAKDTMMATLFSITDVPPLLP